MARRWSRRRRTCWASSRTDCSATSPTSDRWVQTKARAEDSWYCRPASQGSVPDGYFVSRSPTYSVTFAVRGFQVDGKTDQAVALMKQIKIYPLDKASSPPPMEFMNGSRKEIDTLFPDNLRFFELLAMLVDEEPLDSFGPLERSMMQAIGIEKGKPFAPDAKTKALLSEAARLGGAMARANTYDSPSPGVYYYPDRKWQAVPGRHDLQVRARRCAADRRQKQRVLHGGRQLAGDDGEERRPGLAIPVDLSRRRRRLPRRRQELSSARLARTSRRRISGRWSCTTRSAGQSCRTDSPCHRSAATANPRSTRTDQSTLSLARTSRRTKATGSRPFRAGVVSDLPLL